MKATGIVRRIEFQVIIRTRSKSLKNTGVFADFVHFSEPKTQFSATLKKALF